MVNPSGRPQEHDFEFIAKELDAWSLKDDSMSLYQFTYDKTYLAQQLTEFAQQSDIFSLVLRKAKERLAYRREKKCNEDKLKEKIWSKTLHHYDKLDYDLEEHKKDLQAARQKEIENSKPTQLNLMVPHGLASGLNLPTAPVPNSDNNSSK
jgi:hypothetical protein